MTRQSPVRIRYGPFGAYAEELGYRAATVIRRGGKPLPVGGSGDYHARNDLPLLRRQSQAYDRDNTLYHALISRALDNILGDGFRFQARTGNQRTNRLLEELWGTFWESPEIRGMDSGPDTERLALRHLLVDGDVAAIKTSDGLIQLVEAERIVSHKTRNGPAIIEQGIELNPYGRPTAYWVADYDQSGCVSSATPRRYAADDVIYVANRMRISQTRGIPMAVPCFAMIERINDVCDAEAVAWQLLSRLAFTVNRKDAAELADVTSTADADKELPAELAARYHDIGEAIIFHGEPGEEVKGIDRNIPGANFPESIKMFLRILGLVPGMPLELVLLDWSQTNYSSARAALLQAYRMFARWQRLLVRCFHTPIYRWKVGQWIAEGRLPERPGVFDHEWFPPPFPWVDPQKEAEADALLTDRGYSTYAEVLKGQNRDREEMVEQRSVEIREAIAAAKAIEEQTGERVPWQLFAGLDPSKVQSTPAPQPAAQPEEQPEEPEEQPAEEMPDDTPDDEVPNET